MAKIGVLGTGRMGVRLAQMFAQVGHSVTLGSRTPQRAEQIAEALGLSNLRAGEYREAAQAEVIVPAMFLRDGMLDILEPLRQDFDHKVYLDISNPFNDTYTDFILPWDTSGAEHIQHRFPKTRVVGAFKNVWWEVFDAPYFGETLSDVFVVSDDEEAKRIILDLGKNTPFCYIDAGRLCNARTIERMTLLSGELGLRYGYFPRMNYKFLGETWKVGKQDRLGHLLAQ
ncbi:NADP oxidoreductase coenzyme F420-dependent [Gloeomargarita lithophora Alchichica-D10]|uniref:NADP oxidoreductase coenzyme F420-dependent n=1 Tax=Gloeomargarita lithophora Alchichica-D10 TaxID=1188229 RepID=A0A1J0AFT4_9CYAN|nr:NAD(P)-binding domain-containing protein [Gloeomargarita lithophora]APB34776.1 NADP oxidoreductase coenzyme F420-dependent [Gloeomargarita lithophora Alchichica-D10]